MAFLLVSLSIILVMTNGYGPRIYKSGDFNLEGTLSININIVAGYGSNVDNEIRDGVKITLSSKDPSSSYWIGLGFANKMVNYIIYLCK